MTCAEDAGISKRTSTAITGHNTKRNASDGYYAPSPKALKRVIERYPRYDLDLKPDVPPPSKSETARNSDTPDCVI